MWCPGNGKECFSSGDEPYNDSNNDDVPPCASHCVHFNGAKLSFHKWEGCERKQTFLEFFLQFSSIETVFQVQTMILAVSGSTANTADPLDGNGVTPVYAGPWIHQKNTQILQICRKKLMNRQARKVHPKKLSISSCFDDPTPIGFCRRCTGHPNSDSAGCGCPADNQHNHKYNNNHHHL